MSTSPVPFANLRSLIERQISNPAAFKSDQPITGLPEPYGALPHNVFNNLDMISSPDAIITNPDLANARLADINVKLGSSVRNIGFLSVNHAIFEITGAGLFKKVTGFNKSAAMAKEQIETLGSVIYLNRLQAADRLGKTTTVLDKGLSAINELFGIENTFQAIRLTRQIGYFANLKPLERHKEYIDLTAQKTSILEVAQTEEADEVLIKRFDKLPPRWISIIDMESRGLTQTAVANRLQLEPSYYQNIKNKLLNRFSTKSMSRVVYLACKAGVISSNESDMLDLEAEPRSIGDRQIEILNLVAKGLNRKEVADQIGISPHTVNEHIKNIYVRFYASSCEMAIRIAFEKNLLQ